MKYAFVLFLALVSLSGCGVAPDEAALDALAQAGRNTLATSSIGALPSARWPKAVTRLDPERVYVTDEGLYVVTSSFFVQERGLFVPRDPGFMPQAGTDPSYESLRPGVFSYNIAG